MDLPRATNPDNPVSPDDPHVVFIGNPAAGPEAAQLELACHFYGFHLTLASAPGAIPDGRLPVLVVVHASALPAHPAAGWRALQTWTDRHRLPIAVAGITPASDQGMLAQFADGAAIRATDAGSPCWLWVSAADPTSIGFELRGIRLALGAGAAPRLECPAGLPFQTLATVGPTEPASHAALLRLPREAGARYLLARTAEAGAAWQFRRACFGELAPLLLLLRDAGGSRCWHPPAALANLTIDDPWLIEPYGCLTYPGLLAEMQRERFHATIGFVPWNYDRSDPAMVALFRAHPEHFSIAVHGNNHDRYEFFRYEARAGDQQRAKPLAQQAYNIRQALARMAEFHRRTGLDFDRVMVFPHGVCPAPTFGVLKEQGFWATANYSNVPLGESPPADPAVALRSVNTEWDGFPALRRNYPQNLSDEAIAVDLFLGNPVLIMAHQDLFFDGIDAFNPFARRVNARQPSVQWTSLGEISRHLHLLRWRDDGHCDVRLVSRHATIKNPKPGPVDFRLARREPSPQMVARVTLNGAESPWSFVAGEIRFAVTLPPGATGRVEVHYHPLTDTGPVTVQRSGFRNRVLRLVAEFRDLTLSRLSVGRDLARKYYRPGVRRPTVSSLVSRMISFLRGKPK